MKRSVWLSLLLTACSMTMAIAAPRTACAQASDDQQAHAHFQVAASYYEQANYESALREFLEAYRLSHRSQLFYNLSLCYQQLGDLPNAVSYLERYLAEVEAIENRASLETRLANLRERLARDQATGTTSTTTTTTTETDTTVTDTPETDTGTETVTTVETGRATTTDAPPPSSGGSLNVGAIAAFSVAAVGLILGATFTGLAAGEESRIAALPCAASRTCTGADISGMETNALVADIMWGVALAGATVGLVLVLVNPGGGDAEHASLRLTPSLAGLTLDGSF